MGQSNKFDTVLMKRLSATAMLATGHFISCPHTHAHPFNGPFSKTIQVSQYQKGKTSLDFTEARDSEWQWHQHQWHQLCYTITTP